MIFKRKRKCLPFSLIIIIIYTFIYSSSQQCLTYHQYYDPSTTICMPCAYNCLTCPDSNNCAVCSPQFYLDPTTNNSCLKCPFGCQTCSDALTCITCNTGLYINANGDCIPCSAGVSSCSIAVIQSCHNQYFLLGGICAGCLDNCRTCQDFVTCTQCKIGYYLASDQQSCLNCSANCDICTDSNTCTSCAKGYEINSNACVLSNCGSYPFCIKCNSLECLSCEQGKYLAANGSCIQGGTILCQEATGPYYTNCQIDDYDCPEYAVVQQDPFTSQNINVCIPYSATQYAQYIYGTNDISNCIDNSCGNAFGQILTITTIKSYYQIQYNLNIRLYKNPTHTINISVLNTTTNSITSSKVHTKSISLQLSTFSQTQPSCSSCPYGQVYLSGLLLSNGYQKTQFNISDPNGMFTVVEYVFKFYTCTVNKCQTCTTVSDCILCIQPYLLQLVVCVQQCDAGFYKYQRYCLLQCPSDTFSIQSSYQCQACTSPCKTCTSQIKCLSCVNGYFLEGSSCVQTCSSAYYFGNVTSNQCQICPNPCSTCQAINATSVQCLSCMVGYLYQQGKCIFTCPVSLYNTFLNQISQCSSCDNSCTNCYISSSTCLGCASGYLLYSNYCNQTTYCPTGYFVSSNNVCSACQFPCNSCQGTSTNCTSCLKGALYQSQCMTICPNGYYTDSNLISNITCKPCTNNCITCLSSTLCLSCGIGKYLYQNQCVTTCPVDTYYENSSNNTCTQCQPPCKQCTSAIQCLSCATGYLDGTSCTLSCNSSAYINSNFQCILCPSPCIQCYSSTQCIKCQLPNILNGSSCITLTDCTNLGKYVGYTNDQVTNVSLYGECKQCTYPCATCQTSSILCLSCVVNYLYVSDLKTCQQSCPSSYYQSSNQCLKCDSNCYQCNITSTNCTSCSSGRYLDPLTNTCVSICQTGYYSDNQQGKCLQCVSPCLSCYNIYFCKTCKVGIFYNKVCVDICPSGTIFNSTLNQCLFCTDNCLTCNLITSNCTTCISGYYFNSNNNTCASTCPTAYYADSYTQNCQKCISPCSTCTSSTDCVTCVASYYLSNKNCLLSCPTKYYQNNTSMTCDLCNLTICQTCKNNANNCIACALNYFYDSVNSLCVATCLSGFYPQSLLRACKACQFPCQVCTNTTYCVKCETNYKLYLNQCYSSCPIGLYSDISGICQQCPINCQICSSPTNCSKCATNYYVQNGLCVENCLTGMYKGKQEVTNYDYCLTCPATCQDCIDYNTCLKCSAGFYLFNSLCLIECPILHYSETSTLTCNSCPDNCVSCLNSTYCSKCINSYIYNHLCYSQCPTKTYIFNEEECKYCVSPCNQCQSQYTCINCVDGYFYFHAYCVKSCPQGVWYYPNNGSCSQTCPYNKYEQKKICYVRGCGGKLVQMNGYCLQNCPTGYYVSQQQSCIECSTNNNICDNLFIGDLQVLRSYQLTLVLYFNQKSQILKSISDVNITFADYNNNIINLTLKEYQFTQYSLVFKYNYEQVKFVKAYLTIPYLDSQQTNQAISQSSYNSIIYYFNNYQSDPQSTLYKLANYVPIIMTAGLFITIIINVLVKTSYFLQLLDLMQLVAACLYLQIQYPIFLQKFLQQMTHVLFLFMPKLVQYVPYVFSSSKYIFYNKDTSFSRIHLLTFIIFLVILITMVMIILLNKYKEYLPKLSGRIKYRNLNDLFSVLSFPLLLFAFSFFNHPQKIDIVLSIIVIVLTLGWIIFISQLIIQAQQMRDLSGLLSDYEPVSSKLGLMYTPFSYIRRFIVGLVFCVFPEKPLAVLTLLLIFTILILICLFFYQPFASQITDYVSMYLELSLILFIILIVTIGLDIFKEQNNRIIGGLAIGIVILAMAIGLGWLIYLTICGVRKYCQNPDQQQGTQDCIKTQNKSKKQGKDQQQNEQVQQSASNLINKNMNEQKQQNRANNIKYNNNYHIQEIYSQQNSHKQQFKHWNDNDSNEQNSQQNQSNNNINKQQQKPPELLIKKILQSHLPSNNNQQS